MSFGVRADYLKLMDIEELIRQVKHNCNISDAKYWGYYSICGLLMRMRELYFSEHGLMPWEYVEMARIASWLQARESRWQEIEDNTLADIALEGGRFSAFDIEGINSLLKGAGLIYGSGYGTFLKPTFFVAILLKTAEVLDYRIVYAGRELCRDLAAAPAMSQGRCVYVRTELVRSIMWDRFQVMKSRQHRGLLDDMFSQYGISRDDTPAVFAEKSEGLLSDMSQVFARHEIGELFEDDRADEWLGLLGSENDKQTELYLRAVKDLLADSSQAGPLREISSLRQRRLLFVYMSFLDGLRKELFPEIRNAFQCFAESGDWSVIDRAREEGYKKAVAMRDICIGLYEDQGKAGIVPALKDYLARTFPA